MAYTFINSEASSLAARMTAAPSDARAAAIDNLVGRLKSGPISASNIWAKLDVLHVLAAHDSQASLLNWISTSHTASVANGSPVFTADVGWATNGTDSSLSWGFQPADGVQYTQNSASIGIWVTDVGSKSSGSMGCAGSPGATEVTLTPRLGSDLLAYRLNSSGAITVANTNGSGLFMLCRSSSTATQPYRNGAALGSPGATTSTARLAWNVLSGVSSSFVYIANNFRAHVAGANLSADENADVYNSINSYFSEVANPPIMASGTGVAPALSLGLPTAAASGSNGVAPVTATLPLIEAVTLPDGASGALAAKGFTCTGFARAADGTWWISNEGSQDGASVAGQATWEFSLVRLSADFSTILQELTRTTLGRVRGSPQGITVAPDGTLWYVLLENFSVARVYHCTTAGVNLSGSFDVTGGNGLAYDTTRNQLIVAQTAGIRWYSEAGALQAAPRFTPSGSMRSGFDQLHYNAALDRVYMTWEFSGPDGKVDVFDVATYGTPTLIRTDTLDGSQAVEGIYVDGPVFYRVVDDAFRHDVTPFLNRALVFLQDGAIGGPGAAVGPAISLGLPTSSGAGAMTVPGVAGVGAAVAPAINLNLSIAAGSGAMGAVVVPFVLPPAARTLHILADGRCGAGVSEFRHDAAGPWIAKDPDSVLDYGVDWGVSFNSWLGDDVIDAVAWAVSTGLTKGAESNSATVAKVRLSGGTVGVIYTVTCRITTDRGQIDDRSFRIVVRER